MKCQITLTAVTVSELKIFQEEDYFENFACQIHREHAFYGLGAKASGIDERIKSYSFCGGLVKWAKYLDKTKKANRSKTRLPFPDNPPKPDGESAGVADVLASRPTCFSLTSNVGPYYRWLYERIMRSNNDSDLKVENQHPLDKFLYCNEAHEVIISSVHVLHSNDADCHDNNLALVRFCHSAAHTHWFTRTFQWQALWCSRSIFFGRKTDLMPGGV